MRVYRWDLDKTYLLTDFDSWRSLVRSAVEPAHAKRAVPGAPALLKELARERPGWRPRICILSGSPTQMRRVLEDKLRLDGVRYDEFTLKDNLGNLKRGRLRAVKGQFGYKLPRLLAGRVGLGPAARETLFGDDAEVDALVYSVYADAIAGRIAPVELSRVLEAGGAYADHVVDALAALRRVSIADVVDRIFIRLDRGRPREHFEALGSRVLPIRSWLEAAIVLYGAGEVAADGVARVAKAVALPERDHVALCVHALEHGWVAAEAVQRLVEELPAGSAWHSCGQQAARGGWTYRAPCAPERVDYVEVLREFAGWRRQR